MLEGHRYAISEWICEEHRELFMKLSNCRRYPTLRERDIKAFYYRTKRSILSEERYLLRYVTRRENQKIFLKYGWHHGLSSLAVGTMGLFYYNFFKDVFERIQEKGLLMRYGSIYNS